MLFSVEQILVLIFSSNLIKVLKKHFIYDITFVNFDIFIAQTHSYQEIDTCLIFISSMIITLFKVYSLNTLKLNHFKYQITVLKNLQ